MHVMQECQRRPRDVVTSPSDDIILQDYQSDTTADGRIPTPASLQSEPLTRGNGETGTGNRFRHHVTSTTAESPYGCGGTGQLERRLVRTLSRVCETLERGERRLKREDLITSNRVAWQHVSLVVDRLLLIVFTIGTITITLGVLFHAPLSRYFILGYPDNDGIGHNNGRY